ncbi:hypothetical protein FisN_2Hh246 [Fistulifera solaris]|uniref:Uncharacterized protein n=1 Tax=Fistulifera solaris TaxID=1519565 RepID=A0A1Z5JEI6_FISSO|nr:hypothetical protein FisN_2Hh246 [Fistulifera solaris]|eukprot:GAX12415.1 hypothetical protein FisN_2Hh246 [Fistulifera solaris]
MAASSSRGTSVLLILLALLGMMGMFSDSMTVMTATNEMTIETKSEDDLKPRPPKKPKHEIANFLPNVLSGMLDAHPFDLPNRVAVSLRGNSTFLSVGQTIHFLQQHCDKVSESLSSADFRVGLSFLELRPRGTSMSFPSMVEYLVLAYQSLHSLAAACSDTPTHRRPEHWSSLRKGNPSVHVPWIYIPTRDIKGMGDVYSMTIDAVLRAFVSTATRNRPTTKFFGYEANDDSTRSQLEQPADLLTAHQKVQSHVRYHEMVATADALILLKSSNVPKDNLWLEMNNFPFEEWQNDVQKALESLTPTIENKLNKTILCYLDQQNDKQYMLPVGYHKLLKQHFSIHREVDLITIDSANPLDLLYLRGRCPILMGSRSPLLSSITLFLPPGTKIIEHGWDPEPTAYVSAQVLAHGLNYPYLRVFRGQMVDVESNHVPDPQLDTEILRQIMFKGFAPLENFLGVKPLRIKSGGKRLKE